MADKISPRHWKREEDNYLQRLGMLERVLRNPAMRAGYDAMQNPDGSGLMLGGMPGPRNWGEYRPALGGSVEVTPDATPTRYAMTLSHELGHAGNHALTGLRWYLQHLFGNEEASTRLNEYATYPSGSPQAQVSQREMRLLGGVVPYRVGPGAVSAIQIDKARQ